MRPVVAWTAGGIAYQVTAAAGGLELVAVGPGLRFRTASLPRGDGYVADWLTMSEAERTAQAEGALSPSEPAREEPA